MVARVWVRFSSGKSKVYSKRLTSLDEAIFNIKIFTWEIRARGMLATKIIGCWISEY